MIIRKMTAILSFTFIFFALFSCKKECEKVTDSTLFQFGAVQCKFWDKDTIDLKLYTRYGNTKGQTGVPAPVCYDKFVAQFSSKKLGECELYQEKEAEYCLLKDGKIELGIFSKQGLTNSMKFPSIEFISDRQVLIAYIFNGDTIKSIKPCPN